MAFLRRNDVSVKINDAASPSLALNRYSQAKPSQDGAAEKKEGMKAAVKALNEIGSVYQVGFDAWRSSFGSFNDNQKIELTLECADNRRVIVGFGEINVLEAGISLLQPYGVPYIPGSALKGLAAHYCHKKYGVEMNRPGFKIGGAAHNAIFGSTKATGAVLFHDAWLKPESVVGSLKLDILTPHHQDYNVNGAKAPTDFDSPNPVHFLSASGKFVTFLTLNDECCDENKSVISRTILEFAKTILVEALKEEGVGGKTSSGYGLLNEMAGIVVDPILVKEPKEGDVLRQVLYDAKFSKDEKKKRKERLKKINIESAKYLFRLEGEWRGVVKLEDAPEDYIDGNRYDLKIDFIPPKQTSTPKFAICSNAAK